MIAGDMNQYDAVAGLTAGERETLDHELTHKWRNPSTLYTVIVIFSLCAAVQGMDETVVKGAQCFHQRQFSIGDPHATKGKQKKLPSLTYRWHMFTARFFLGFGIGPQVRYDPDVCGRVFAVEAPRCSSHAMADVDCLRHHAKLVADLVLYDVPDGRVIGLNWGLTMGSAMIPALVVCAIVYFAPEIPHGSTAHLACIALGIYLFGVVYSPGEGPLPFTYSAETYSLYIRATGISLATATTWFFNAIISLTWPSLVAAWTEQGAFSCTRR
ncbi:hypothetical protein DL767_007409 [Monosporascus sp. MG133]|nr:hypothetical protein DL767_007409 [Monosporascus sp. MG133]